MRGEGEKQPLPGVANVEGSDIRPKHQARHSTNVDVVSAHVRNSVLDLHLIGGKGEVLLAPHLGSMTQVDAGNATEWRLDRAGIEVAPHSRCPPKIERGPRRCFPQKDGGALGGVDAWSDVVLGPDPEETGGDVRVALTLEFRQRLENLRRIQPLILLISREREHLGASSARLGRRLVAHNLEMRSRRLEAWMEAGAIAKRDPVAPAAVALHTLTGYHLSTVFFRRAPGGPSEQDIIATLVDLVVGDWGHSSRPLHGGQLREAADERRRRVEPR